MGNHSVETSKIKVTYIDHMGDDLRVVNSARISFLNESDILNDKDKKLIKYLAENEHMSPFEHNILTVVIECPLYIRSQIHRHRTFSYNEQSRRYTSENIQFFTPDKFRKQSKSNRQASDGYLEPDKQDLAKKIVYQVHEYLLEEYHRMLDIGVCREQARGILGMDVMTKFYMTGNVRNWAHFIRLRKDNHAQEEVQTVANQVENILNQKFPESLKYLI